VTTPHSLRYRRSDSASENARRYSVASDALHECKRLCEFHSLRIQIHGKCGNPAEGDAQQSDKGRRQYHLEAAVQPYEDKECAQSAPREVCDSTTRQSVETRPLPRRSERRSSRLRSIHHSR